jgi:hypothetical protein
MAGRVAKVKRAKHAEDAHSLNTAVTCHQTTTAVLKFIPHKEESSVWFCVVCVCVCVCVVTCDSCPAICRLLPDETDSCLLHSRIITLLRAEGRETRETLMSILELIFLAWFATNPAPPQSVSEPPAGHLPILRRICDLFCSLAYSLKIHAALAEER